VLFVGVAQEKARVPRTIRKRFGEGGSIPWIDYTSAMVNFYYFYCVDEDFEPFFIKFCSYFPYTAKLCLNGHEYLKRQLQKRRILHVYYKNTHIKQYHKEGRALRIETTIHNTYDFQVGRLLKNLPRLRQIGFGANRRVLEVEKVSHDSQVGAKVFEKMQKPLEVEGQHASALRFGDPRVQAVLSVLLLFALQPEGVRNRQLRPLLAQYLGIAENQITQGKMSYDLRRLRLHGIIDRIEDEIVRFGWGYTYLNMAQGIGAHLL
jgi:hypothetical protein